MVVIMMMEGLPVLRNKVLGTVLLFYEHVV